MRILLRCSEFVYAKRAHICCGLRRNRRTAGRRMCERSGCRAADGMVLPGGFLENALSFLDKTDEKAGTRRAFRHAGKAGALRAGGKICSGTTVTMVFVRGRRFVLVHLGDSRAYQLCRKCCLNRENRPEPGSFHRIMKRAACCAAASGRLGWKCRNCIQERWATGTCYCCVRTDFIKKRRRIFSNLPVRGTGSRATVSAAERNWELFNGPGGKGQYDSGTDRI